MSDAQCPGCRGYVDLINDDQAQCQDCGWIVPADILPDLSRLAVFDVRQRLPTLAEEVAHLARWGEGAGFMLRSTDPLTMESYRHPTWVTAGRSAALLMLRTMVERGVYLVECWAVTAEGRPVAWPPEGA